MQTQCDNEISALQKALNSIATLNNLNMPDKKNACYLLK